MTPHGHGWPTTALTLTGHTFTQYSCSQQERIDISLLVLSMGLCVIETTTVCFMVASHKMLLPGVYLVITGNLQSWPTASGVSRHP